MRFKDGVIAGSIGILTGVSGVFLLQGLGLISLISLAFGLNIGLIFLLAPLLTATTFTIGLAIGDYLSKQWPAMGHFARFAIIGFSNATIDFGLLNVLILTTGISQGLYFSIFKTIGFTAALINSYIWNRYWTFKTEVRRNLREFVIFASVVCGSLLINVGISSLIVNFIQAPTGISMPIWANIASIIAVSIGLFWNFIGMRLFVFKHKERDILKETL